MRVFSIQNMLLLAFMMSANGNIMSHIPQPLQQLLGKGTAIAMSDKFDMNSMLLELHAQQRQATANIQPINYQPYNFSGGTSGNNLAIQQKPFPKAELEEALGNNQIPPAVRQQVNELYSVVLGQIAATQRAAL